MDRITVDGAIIFFFLPWALMIRYLAQLSEILRERIEAKLSTNHWHLGPKQFSILQNMYTYICTRIYSNTLVLMLLKSNPKY